jgi:hypothetical protein
MHPRRCVSFDQVEGIGQFGNMPLQFLRAMTARGRVGQFFQVFTFGIGEICVQERLGAPGAITMRLLALAQLDAFESFDSGFKGPATRQDRAWGV